MKEEAQMRAELWAALALVLHAFSGAAIPSWIATILAVIYVMAGIGFEITDWRQEKEVV